MRERKGVAWIIDSVRLPGTSQARNVALALSALWGTARVPERPDRVVRALGAMRPYGFGVLGGIAGAVARYPEATALQTDSGRLTYSELWQEAERLARALRAEGVTGEDRVGLLAKNNLFFVVALIAISRLGADVVLFNTAMACPQTAEVAVGEGVGHLLHDDELRSVAQHCDGVVLGESELRNKAMAAPQEPLLPPSRISELVVLTSGTTGRPKGARRPSGGASVFAASAFAGRLPWRVRRTVVVPAPFFHAWGLSVLLISLSLSCTVVTRRDFDALGTLADVADNKADMLALVPVMMQRILALDASAFVEHDTHHLRGIVSSGSALPAPVAEAAMLRFGPILYNVYGSTEVSAATIAAPGDLRRDPQTAGRPAPGVRVEVVDADGARAAVGETGRVFVGSSMRFEGYTAGEGKQVIRGMLSTGDLGVLDRSGCLRVVGREDDMVVSGGENVYPGAVEDLLANHPDIAEVAVIGVPDDEFGQRLKAFVVTAPGAALEADQVREYVRTTLSRYEVPKAVEFLDELPRTATGKILRRELI
jgi:fatty-acyl-CoA synthase